MRLLLLRHGQTPANVLGRLDTARPGPGLTDLGLRQAAAIPNALRIKKVDAIYASTLVRTQLTAAPLSGARRLPVAVLDGLREIEAGDLEGLSDSRSQMIYLTTAFAWAEGDLDRRMPGGPTGHDFFARFDSAVADIISAVESDGGPGTSDAPGDAAVNPAPGPSTATGSIPLSYVPAAEPTVAIFSHGMALRTWAAARCRNIDGSYASSHELGNTGLVVLHSVFGEATGTNWVMSQWVCEPVGGIVLSDENALDPTGETLQEARRHIAP